MQKFDKKHCIAVLLEVMKEHAESPWFHINDIPKPIRRVFYARMKTASCSVNDEPGMDTIKATKDEVMSNASVTTDNISVMTDESVKKEDNRARKNVREKRSRKTDKQSVPPKKEILGSIEAHCFPDGNKTFKEVQSMSTKTYAPIARELEYQSLIKNGHVNYGEVQREMDNISARETDRSKLSSTSASNRKINKTLGGIIQGDVSYSCMPINQQRCSQDQHQTFWETIFGFSYSELAIPRSTQLREECFSKVVDLFGSGPLEVIIRKEVRCKKIFVDLRIVRTGTYHKNEYPNLFKR